jgi:hypothetical protein
MGGLGIFSWDGQAIMLIHNSIQTQYVCVLYKLNIKQIRSKRDQEFLYLLAKEVKLR